MGSADPRAPVIVGVGQISVHDASASPLDLMVAAAQRAVADCGESAAKRMLAEVGQISVPSTFSWPIPDPARILAGELGVEGAETARSANGGTAPLHLLAHACDRIVGGEIEAAILAGGEAVRPFMRAVAEGGETGWPSQTEGTVPDRFVGTDREAGHPAELAAGLIAPVNYYPLFEQAIRARWGRSPAEHQAWLGELWARLSAVAADNPYAWGPTGLDPGRIADLGEGNRMAVHPYPKLLTANIQVDQGAALVVCSDQAADAAGVPRDRRVYVRSAAAATDHWFTIEREFLDRSPAIAACGREALGHADLAIDEIDHLDIYSCFPSAVQISAAELGIDLATDTRPPTVTGGLTFAGGPANNSCSHALAQMVSRIRETGGSGLVTGVGWYMTKHAITILSADPPPKVFAAFDAQPEVDSLPKREAAEAASGTHRVESWTAVYDRAGVPSMGVVSCLLPDGSRALAGTLDPATAARLVESDPLGGEVELRGSGFEL